MYDILMSDLTDIQKKRVDAFIDAATWTATIGEKYAYQQGMKDLLSLLKALSENERQTKERVDFYENMSIIKNTFCNILRKDGVC